MTTLKAVALAAMLFPLVACDSGGGAPKSQTAVGTGGVSGSSSGGAVGGGDGRVPLVNWVDDLAENHNVQTDPPDTVEDKVAIIIDTEDPAAFDPLLQRQATQQP